MQQYALLLVRHAIAAERGAAWPDDDERPLTARGIDRFRTAAIGIARLAASVDEVWSSPLRRARQTADLLAAALPRRPAVKTCDVLSPGFTASAVMTEMQQVATPARLALVGHEPGLGELAAYLLSAGEPLPFRKGGACLMSIGSVAPPFDARLQWFLPPRVLRQVARAAGSQKRS
jgi:phosphohistidine phosphatase